MAQVKRVVQAIAALVLACVTVAQVTAGTRPLSNWAGTSAALPNTDVEYPCTIAYPTTWAAPIRAVIPDLPAGVYRLHLGLRPSHPHQDVAWQAGLKVSANETIIADWPAIHFRRVHEPEDRWIELVHEARGDLTLSIAAHVDTKAFEQAMANVAAKEQTVSDQGTLDMANDDDDALLGGELALEFTPDPARGFYYLLDEAQLHTVSTQGQIANVTVNKILYEPGERLQGNVDVRRIGDGLGDAQVVVALAWGLDEEQQMLTLPVPPNAGWHTLSFEFTLPNQELGHAVTARLLDGQGGVHGQAGECFNIAENFMRVAMPGEFGGHGYTHWSDEKMKATIDHGIKNYSNYTEWFAWAEEDMVEMSPASDYWYSGQTSYYLYKEGAKRMVKHAHDRGVKVVTYGKFIMSGYLGWKFAYDHPYDCKSQFHFPVGMWNGANVPSLDIFQFKEFVPYTTHWFHPAFQGRSIFGSVFGGATFMPINPDATARMTRVAAEEVIRAIDMFGFDAVRWDGHPRTGPQMEAEKYDYAAQRRTELLLRYFKDLVKAKHPNFRHGYNTLPLSYSYDWAVENYELDELCRRGGLIMNEAQGNAVQGKTYEFRMKVLQTQGDLCRERGGYLLGTLGTGMWSGAPMERMYEAIIKYASGCRGRLMHNDYNRHVTRYSAFVFDERLRRLGKPGAILKPAADTRLLWEPFVYETPAVDGRAQLVVNLLNMPLDERWTVETNKHFDNTLPKATAPLGFRLNMPEGYQVKAVYWLDPLTSRRTALPLVDGMFTAPSVSAWEQVVVDLAVSAGAAPLHEKFGVPRTVGKKRPDIVETRQPLRPIDMKKEVWEVNKNMAEILGMKPSGPFDEDGEFVALTEQARSQKLMARRDSPAQRPDTLAKSWWKGARILQDLELQDKKPSFPKLEPQRDSTFDVFYGRGCLDLRLGIYDSLAHGSKFRVHAAPFRGNLRFGGSVSYRLNGGPRWSDFPNYDLLVYADIPHAAIGIENSYALVPYVKAGGAVYFTGGEFAFGKGGYLWTVLDRELLPVHCVEMVDTRYSETPLPVEEGPDWPELGDEGGFRAPTSMWCWNQVVLKPGAKVFLKSGNRPVLVGWELGKGRVACLLATHKGKSERGTVAFFDSPDWPRIQAALFRWLTPNHRASDKPAASLEPERLEEIRSQLDGDVMTDAIDADDGGGGLLDETVGEAATEAVELPADVLELRVALLEELCAGSGEEACELIAGQLTTIENLPAATQFRGLAYIAKHNYEGLADLAADCLAQSSPAIRGCGYQLLGMAGDRKLRDHLAAKATGLERPRQRARHLACAAVLFPGDALMDDGQKVLAAIDAEEEKWLAIYTRGTNTFTLKAPEQPLIDSEQIFARLAWLAYLSRFQPERYGARLVRQWMMVAQYNYYCHNRISTIWEDKVMSKAQKQQRVLDVKRYKGMLNWLSEICEADVLRLANTHPAVVGDGLSRVHFFREAQRAINFLGRYDAAGAKVMLAGAAKSQQPVLAAFGNARRSASRPPR